MEKPEESKPAAEAASPAPAKLAVKQVKSKGELLRFAAPPPAVPPSQASAAAPVVPVETEAESEAEDAAVATPAEADVEVSEAVSAPPAASAPQVPKPPVVTGKGELLRFAPKPAAAPEEGQAPDAAAAAPPPPKKLTVADDKPQPKRLALPDTGEKEPPPSLADKLPKRIKVAAPADPLDAAMGRRPAARAKARAPEEEDEGRAPVGRGTKLKRRMRAVEQSNKTTQMVVGMAVAAFLIVAVGIVLVIYANRKPVADVDILQIATQSGPDETEAIPMETRQAVWTDAWINEARATRDAEAQYPMNAQDGLKDTREQGLKRQRYKERLESSYNFETAKKHTLAPHLVDAIVQAGLRKGWKMPTEAELGTAVQAVAAKPESAAADTDTPAAARDGAKSQAAAGAGAGAVTPAAAAPGPAAVPASGPKTR